MVWTAMLLLKCQPNKKIFFYFTVFVGMCKIIVLFNANPLSPMFGRWSSRLLNKQWLYFTFYRFARRHYRIACDCEYSYLASFIPRAHRPAHRPHWGKSVSKQAVGEMTQQCCSRVGIAQLLFVALWGIECMYTRVLCA